MATRTTTTRITATDCAVSGVESSAPKLFSPPDPELLDLFDAYFMCRKHKRNTINQLKFEENLERNLVALWEDLLNGRYNIGSSIAFIITEPKVREVWAADFRDRVVHHLIYNAIAPHFHARFIRDSYACIPGRGAHDGKRRVEKFARSITAHWARPAFVLKVDVANFFNSIDQNVLMDIVRRQISPGWCLDLIEQVVGHDPRPNAVYQSTVAQFDLVPPRKSFLKAENKKGLPIGNLTSQFFANLYMNELDQFVKQTLQARYYGRYVDDMVLMSESPVQLNDWCRQIDSFLWNTLKMRLHPQKIWMNDLRAGLNFVGFIIRPGRTTLRRSTLNKCRDNIRNWNNSGAVLHKTNQELFSFCQSVTSYLGMLRQVDGYRARRRICMNTENLFIRADERCTKIQAV